MPPDRETNQAPKPRRPQPIMDMIPAGYNRPKPTKIPAVTAKTVPPKPLPQLAHTNQTAKIQPQTSHEAPAKKHSSDTERPSALFIVTFLLILLVIGLASAGAYYYFKTYKPAHKPVVAQSGNKPTTDNANHITDDTHGIKFAITKDLTAISSSDLAKLNPAFIYGYDQKDVPNVACIISQQKRDPPGGPVNPESLRDGTLKGTQKSYPDAKLQDYSEISLANGQDGASLRVTYTDQQTKIEQKMVVVATEKTVTFTFCKAPESIFKLYNPKFQQFLDSLEVY